MLFALCATAEAQQLKKVARLGYISATDSATDSTRAQAIRKGLGEFGYVEGQNVAIEYRYADGKRDRYPDLLAELVRLKPDLILIVGGDPLIRAAMNTTKSIPIVMTGGGADPVEAGLVGSLSRPGGNATGITNLSNELGGKRLELLKEAVPKLVRVAILYDPVLPASVLDVKETLPDAARALGLTVQPWAVPNENEFEKVFVALKKQRPDGLYVLGGAIIRDNGKRISTLALKSRLP